MDYTKQLDWILPVAFNAFIIVAEIWILLSVVHYGMKTKKWKITDQGNLSKLNSGRLFTALVLCAAFCIIYSVSTLVYLNVGFNPGEDKLCNVVTDISNSIYALRQIAVYAFLWLRQRAFYTNHMLNITYNKNVKIFSAISIFIIVFAAIGILIFNVYPNDDTSSSNGCRNGGANKLLFISGALIVLGVLFGQVTLVGLFLYALAETGNQDKSFFAKLRDEFCCRCCCCCNKFTQKEVSTSYSRQSFDESLTNVSQISFRTNCNTHSVKPISLEASQLPSRSEKSSAENIRQVMRKTMGLAIISIVSDVFVPVFSFFVSSLISDHFRFLVIVLNIHTILSLLLLVFSFTVYRKMLSSFCSCV